MCCEHASFQKRRFSKQNVCFRKRAKLEMSSTFGESAEASRVFLCSTPLSVPVSSRWLIVFSSNPPSSSILSAVSGMLPEADTPVVRGGANTATEEVCDG